MSIHSLDFAFQIHVRSRGIFIFYGSIFFALANEFYKLPEVWGGQF